MSEPSITAVKTLFAESRNLCFFTACEERLTDPAWKQVNGEVAHIKGERLGSARFDENQPNPERQGYGNLMLLCPRHHKLIDRLLPDDYSVEALLEMKAKHIFHRADGQWITDEQAQAFAVQAVAEAVRAAVAATASASFPRPSVTTSTLTEEARADDVLTGLGGNGAVTNDDLVITFVRDHFTGELLRSTAIAAGVQLSDAEVQLSLKRLERSGRIIGLHVEETDDVLGVTDVPGLRR